MQPSEAAAVASATSHFPPVHCFLKTKRAPSCAEGEEELGFGCNVVGLERERARARAAALSCCV